MRKINLPGLFIDEPLFKQIKSDKIEINAGNQSCQVQVLCDPSLQSSKAAAKTRINPRRNIARKLLLPMAFPMHYYCNLPVVKLGPVVGIFTLSGKNRKKPLTGKKAKLYAELISYARKCGVFVYCFFPGAVGLPGNTLKGYSLNQKGEWITGDYPWPDIIYNRIRSRRAEKKTSILNLIDYFKNDSRVYFFNTRYLNKWEVYQALIKYPEGKSLVPETECFTRAALYNFIDKYGEVLLKPSGRSLGKGIVKVISRRERFLYARAESSGGKWTTCNSLDDLYSSLKNANSEEEYLLQQIVPLGTYKGRIFDLRTQYQKNGQGDWILTGTGVRVAGKGRFVTHIPNGGRALSYEKVIGKIFTTAQKTYLDSQLDSIGAIVPAILERELGINLGILSMDIGVDTDGRMLILEVNSKPSSFDEDDIRKQHHKYLVDYFIYICGEKNKRNGSK